jgi:hypothetical protein
LTTVGGDGRGWRLELRLRFRLRVKRERTELLWTGPGPDVDFLTVRRRLALPELAAAAVETKRFSKSATSTTAVNDNAIHEPRA